MTDRSWAPVTTDPTASKREYYNSYPKGYDHWSEEKKIVWLLEQNKLLLDQVVKTQQPPTKPFRTKIVLNDNHWHPLTNLIRWGEIRAWKLRNMTHRLDKQFQQFIEWAYQDDPEDFEIDDLGPGGIETQDTWPEDLWVRRTVAPALRANFPVVLIEIWYVTDIRQPESQPLWPDVATEKIDRYKEESLEVQGFDENELWPPRY